MRAAAAAYALAIALPLLGFTVAPRSARAEAGTGDVVFVRGSSLWRLPARATGAPVVIATLPPGAKTVEDLSSAGHGATLLLTIDGIPHWVTPDPDAPPVARPLPCSPTGNLSPNGRCVVCVTDHQLTVIRLGTDHQTRRKMAARDSAFLGPAGREIVFRDDAGVWALSRRLPQPRRLAPHTPDRNLLTSPDGKRAVGVYREGDSASLETFRLDGTAVRRKLLRDATPITWSADSEWLLVQQERSACIVRGVGGQYKCWRGYQGLGLAPDGSYALLVKEAEHPNQHSPGDRFDLYWAELAGADAHRPVARLRNVVGAAVWLPAD